MIVFAYKDLAGDNEINYMNEMEPPSKTKHPNEKSCIVMIGDSIIKHIDPKKLSKTKVYKYTYPGDTAKSIATKVCALKPQIAPSHVVIHMLTQTRPARAVVGPQDKQVITHLRAPNPLDSSAMTRCFIKISGSPN